MYNAQEVGALVIDCTTSSTGRRGAPGLRAAALLTGHSRRVRPNAVRDRDGIRNHAAVAATEGILQTLNDDELEGVLGHELAHVKHPATIPHQLWLFAARRLCGPAIMMSARLRECFFRRRAAAGRPAGAGKPDSRSVAMMILAPIRRRLLIQAGDLSRVAGEISTRDEAGAVPSPAAPRGPGQRAEEKYDAASKGDTSRTPILRTAHMFIIKAR